MGINAAQGRRGRGWDRHAQGLSLPPGPVGPHGHGQPGTQALRSHAPPHSGAGGQLSVWDSLDLATLCWQQGGGQPLQNLQGMGRVASLPGGRDGAGGGGAGLLSLPGGGTSSLSRPCPSRCRRQRARATEQVCERVTASQLCSQILASVFGEESNFLPFKNVRVGS